MEYFDLALNYNYERSIIRDLMKGKDVEMYTLDDYYDHCFTESLSNRIKRLGIDEIPEDGTLLLRILNTEDERIEDRIDFLLKLSKVLKEMNRYSDAKDILRYTEEIIKTSQLSPTDNEHFTVVLKNYRNL